jgi:hypothetical protein
MAARCRAAWLAPPGLDPAPNGLQGGVTAIAADVALHARLRQDQPLERVRRCRDVVTVPRAPSCNLRKRERGVVEDLVEAANAVNLEFGELAIESRFDPDSLAALTASAIVARRGAIWSA